MDAQTAADLINENLAYKPGWSFTARDHSGRFLGTVEIRVDYVAPNSAREHAEAGYPQLLTPNASFTVPVFDLDSPEALWLRVFDEVIVPIELHEAREFYRLRAEDYRAPFHPHIPEGAVAYLASHPGHTLDADVRFGIA